jgi:hypothetical protein
MGAIGFLPATAPLSAEQLAVGDKRFDRLDGGNRSLHVFPNALINSSFDHWQRGNGPFALTGGGSIYGPDRWRLFNVGPNGSVTITRQPLSFGDWPSQSRLSVIFGGSGNTATADGIVFQQPIEGVDTFAGKRVVVRGGIRLVSGAAGSKVSVELVQNFGTGGSASVYTDAGRVALSGVLTPFAAIVDVPSMAGKVIGSAGDFLGLQFWCSSGSDYAARTGNLGFQAITVQLVDVEVKEVKPGYGDQYPGFERVPRETDYDRCLRFYEQSWLTEVDIVGLNTAVGFGTVHPTGACRIAVRYRKRKRINPVLAIADTNLIRGAVSIYYTSSNSWVGGQGYSLLSGSAEGFYFGHNNPSSIETQGHYIASADY